MKEDKVFFRNSKGLRLCGLLAVPDGEGPFPIVIGAHGFKSNKESSKVKRLSELLPEEGIAFLRIDFSGRGESEGKFEDTTITGYVDDLNSAVDYLVQDGRFLEVGLFGSSMGGFVSIITTHQLEKTEAMYLAAPLINFRTAAEHYASDELMKDYKKRGYAVLHRPEDKQTSEALKIKYGFIEDGLKYDLYPMAEKIKCPVMIMHSRNDDRVSFSDTERFFRKLMCEHELVEYPGNHYFSDKTDFDRLIETAVGFFRKTLLDKER